MVQTVSDPVRRGFIEVVGPGNSQSPILYQSAFFVLNSIQAANPENS